VEARDRTKVLYIAGFGRSGSTLLGNVLGEVEGFFSVGELRQVWEYGFLGNKICGCGAPFGECEVWRPVVDEAFGGIDGVDPREMIRLRESWARTKHIPLMLVPPGRRLVERHLAEYLDALGRLYEAIATVTGSRAIVDNSKFPSYGYVLGMALSVDLYVVHLVRDPRAVAYSWQRKKRLQPDPETPEYMPRRGPAESSIRWTARNLAADALRRRAPGARYLLLRYEDFVAKPQKAIGRVLELVEEETASRPEVRNSNVGAHEVDLGANHNVWGNPGRFRTGTVEIRSDTEWTYGMRLADARLVSLLTFPLLARYGYPLAVPVPGGRISETKNP
jgi:hypothetical protein